MKRAKTKITSPGARTKRGTEVPGESPATTGETPVLPTGHLFFTKPEMAQLLKVSLRTLCEMMDRGEIAYLKIGGKIVRFRLEDVQRRLTETCLICNAPQGIDTSPYPLPVRGGEGAPKEAA